MLQHEDEKVKHVSEMVKDVFSVHVFELDLQYDLSHNMADPTPCAHGSCNATT